MKTTTEANETVANLDNYIRRNGNVYSSWYVGIAADPRGRLFGDHKVRENGDAWIYEGCESDTAARQVEQRFLAAGCQGGSGGGDVRSRYVYAYKIATHTIETA